MNKKIYYLIYSPSFGDTLAATPTLRYLSQSHQSKINIVTHNTHIFKHNPYVDACLSFSEFELINKENIIKYESFTNAGRKDGNGIEKKFAHIDLRQIHAFDLGFQLMPHQMEYDFYPDPVDLPYEFPETYVVCQITQNWPNRTWATENWQELVNLLSENKIFTVLVGKDHFEKVHDSISVEPIPKKCPQLKNLYGLDLSNKLDLDGMFHVINNSTILITMCSGAMNIGGCTDTHILQVGSAQNPLLRAPYRKGSQDYKYHFVGGSCNIFCNMDLRYNVLEWGDINSVPPLTDCREKKPTFECHPKPIDVFHKVTEILNLEPTVPTKFEKRLKFGIYTSFYNCEKYVNKIFSLVESINYDNFEWHITDDYSQDSTKDTILKRLESSSIKDKIKYYEQSEKKQMYWKPNLFFDDTFDWIILVDSDDSFDKNFLNVYNNFLIDNEEITVVSSDFFKIYDDSDSLHSISYILNNSNISKKLDKYHPSCDYLNNISYSCFGCLRGFKNIIPSFDVTDMLACAEDSYHVFWANSFGKYLHIPRPLYTWHMREDSESHNKTIPHNFNANFDIALSKLNLSDGGVDMLFNDIYVETCTLGSCDIGSLEGKKVSLWTRDLHPDQKEKLKKLYYDVDLVFNDINAELHLYSLNYFSLSELNISLENIKGKKMLFYYQNQKHHENNEEKDIELDSQLNRYLRVVSHHTGYSWWKYIRHFIISS